MFDQVLACDGCRCVVTGMFDEASLNHCLELRDICSVFSVQTETAHIFKAVTVRTVKTAETTSC